VVYSLLELVSLPCEAFDLGFERVHLTDQHAVMLRLALDVHLQLALALRDVHQAALQQLKVLVQSETSTATRSHKLARHNWCGLKQQQQQHGH